MVSYGFTKLLLTLSLETSCSPTFKIIKLHINKVHVYYETILPMQCLSQIFWFSTQFNVFKNISGIWNEENICHMVQYGSKCMYNKLVIQNKHLEIMWSYRKGLKYHDQITNKMKALYQDIDGTGGGAICAVSCGQNLLD